MNQPSKLRARLAFFALAGFFASTHVRGHLRPAERQRDVPSAVRLLHDEDVHDVRLNTETTRDWTNKQWIVPLNVTVGQLLKVGGKPISLTLGAKSARVGRSKGTGTSGSASEAT
jgi:hypothetical protein